MVRIINLTKGILPKDKPKSIHPGITCTYMKIRFSDLNLKIWYNILNTFYNAWLICILYYDLFNLEFLFTTVQKFIYIKKHIVETNCNSNSSIMLFFKLFF